MAQRLSKVWIAGIVLACVAAVSAQPAAAIYNGCWACYTFDVPNPTGGIMQVNRCVMDLGSAVACEHYGTSGCVEWWPGQCV